MTLCMYNVMCTQLQCHVYIHFHTTAVIGYPPLGRRSARACRSAQTGQLPCGMAVWKEALCPASVAFSRDCRRVLQARPLLATNRPLSLPWSGGRLAFCGARVSTARWCALVPYTGKQHTPCHTRTSLLLKAWRATAVRTRTPS